MKIQWWILGCDLSGQHFGISLWSFWIFKLLSCKGLIVNLTLSLNTLYCHILICKVSLTYVQAFLSYKRLKFSRFFGFDSFPWDFRGNFFSRNALLVTINAHTKFYQNRLMGQFSMEVLTTSLYATATKVLNKSYTD